MDLQNPIKEAGGIFKMYASRLEKLGIKTIEDLLYHVPSRYEDYSIIAKIQTLQPGEVVTVQGTVLEIKNIYTRRFKNIQKATINDGAGNLEITWFNQPFIVKNIHQGDFLSISGKVDLFNQKPVITPSEYEVINESPTIHTGRLVPIYPETRGVSSKWLRSRISRLLSDILPKIQEYLPDFLLSDNHFPTLPESIASIHFPKTVSDVKTAKNRLSFDELFLTQLSGLQRRSEWEKTLTSHPFSIAKYRKQISLFWHRLPFELTGAQKRAVKEIFHDLASKKPMNRLLEGDVGSGKTVVSAIAMYLARLNGYQSVLMAPTEILAHQHYNTISNLLSPFDVKVELVTSNKKLSIVPPKARLAKGGNSHSKTRTFSILIGTHAILSKKIVFDKLGLVVIDEQQRFGVEQRAIIRKKGINPHVLIMTATPIPRTVALTMYGDLDLSYLDEMPLGRKKVKTWLVPPVKRSAAYEWIESQIREHHTQTFIICPFIEESESLATVKAATKEYEYLRKNIFPKLRPGLIHGRLKAKEKQTVLASFRDGKLDILVATPVVEVGIDIPNATIMMIEASERFGLAQLHQLRGRVGRSDKQSYCLLFTESKGDYTQKRLKAMETIHVGAELAELDLKLRGPGEMYGTIQHGTPSLKIASFSDFSLIEKTRRAAEKVFPRLSNYPLLQTKLTEITTKPVSPD